MPEEVPLCAGPSGSWTGQPSSPTVTSQGTGQPAAGGASVLSRRWRRRSGWLTTIIPYILLAQVSSYTVVQCLTMDRHMGPHFQVPAASFQAFALALTAVLVPLYDPYFVPLARRLTGNPRGLSSLQRNGTGLGISVFCMLSAALVEVRRKGVAKQHGLLDHPYAQIPVTAFYLLPQIVILGATEMFLTVGQLEFLYEEMPDAMRSLRNSLYCSAVSVGYFITSFLIPTVTRLTRHGSYGGWLAPNINRGDLQNFYWLLMALSIANVASFLLASRLYRYKQLDPGSRVGVIDVDDDDDSSADKQRLDPRVHGSPESMEAPPKDQVPTRRALPTSTSLDGCASQMHNR